MKTIGVFFGGRSCEHDVSIITAHQAMANLDPSKFRVEPVYIARDGRWYMGDRLRDIAFYSHFDPLDVDQVYLDPNAGYHGLYKVIPPRSFLWIQPERTPVAQLDCALLCMHGMHGEDGALSGLLELAEIPYTCSSLVGSSVGMDKIAMRILFKGAGFPVLPFASVLREDFKRDPLSILEQAEVGLTYPIFVKPANLGSSIGITRATDRASLRDALEVAFAYDSRVMLDQGIEHVKEINCSALGYGSEVQVSVCEQPVSWEEFLTFNEKYTRSAGDGMESLSRIVPAPIPDDMTGRIQRMTADIFRTLNCKGVVRIDFMIDEDTGELYVNEINTIPGSLAYYLWEPMGLSFPKLLERLIDIAEKAEKDEEENSYAYESVILQNFGGAKGAKGGAKGGAKFGSKF